MIENACGGYGTAASPIIPSVNADHTMSEKTNEPAWSIIAKHIAVFTEVRKMLTGMGGMLYGFTRPSIDGNIVRMELPLLAVPGSTEKSEHHNTMNEGSKHKRRKNGLHKTYVVDDKTSKNAGDETNNKDKADKTVHADVHNHVNHTNGEEDFEVNSKDDDDKYEDEEDETDGEQTVNSL
uniref:Uncharacterized protein n=1 Tax=Lygus hesperus TaxID=30085 RepID=A0A0A9XHX3_LYGHE